MTPDGSGYKVEFSRADSIFPDKEAQEYLEKQQARGYMLGHYVKATRRRDQRDRLIEEAINEIKRLRALVEQHGLE